MTALERFTRRIRALSGRQVAAESSAARRSIRSPFPHVCGVSDSGPLRLLNEDRFHISDDGRVLVVVDGMGGHANGALASALAVDAVADFVRTHPSPSGDVETERTIKTAVSAAHAALMAANRESTGRNRMGAAIVVASVDAGALWVCHVGDARCYVRSAEGLCRITEDHAIAADVEPSRRSGSEAPRNPTPRGAVRRALGIRQGYGSDIAQWTIADGDRVLLCSDGLWEALDDADIAELLVGRGPIDEVAERLVDSAISQGATDNITAVVYAYQPQNTEVAK